MEAHGLREPDSGGQVFPAWALGWVDGQPVQFPRGWRRGADPGHSPPLSVLGGWASWRGPPGLGVGRVRASRAGSFLPGRRWADASAGGAGVRLREA